MEDGFDVPVGFALKAVESDRSAARVRAESGCAMTVAGLDLPIDQRYQQ